MKLTKAQRRLISLAGFGWTLDRHGKGGFGAIAYGSRSDRPVVFSAKTVGSLIGDGMIRPTAKDIVGYRLTDAGCDAFSTIRAAMARYQR